MSTLTQTSLQIRLTVKVLLIMLGVIIGYRIVYKVLAGAIQAAKKPKIAKPTNAFGKLPYPEFVTIQTGMAGDYELDLIDGKLPTSPEKVVVYKKIPFTSGLLSPERAKRIATNFKFVGSQYNEISPTVYEWKDTKLPRVLTVNTITRTLNLTLDYKGNSSLFSPYGSYTKQSSITKAISLLTGYASMPTDIKEDDGNVQLFVYDSETGDIVPSRAQDRPQAAKIYLQRKNIVVDKNNNISYPVVATTPDEGPIYIVINNSGKSNQEVMELKFNYFGVDSTKTATYLTRKVDQAWQDVQNGKESVVILEGDNKDTLSSLRIKRVYLAYYDQATKQDYMQPVWVFEGEAIMSKGNRIRYVSYVPAVTDDWLQDKNASAETTTE